MPPATSIWVFKLVLLTLSHCTSLEENYVEIGKLQCTLLPREAILLTKTIESTLFPYSQSRSSRLIKGQHVMHDKFNIIHFPLVVKTITQTRVKWTTSALGLAIFEN